MSDIEVDIDSSVVRLTPLSDFAREWIDEHLATEGWQWLGRCLVVDHRVAQDLLALFEQHGLVLTT